MNPKDAATMISRIFGITPTKTQMHELVAFLDLLTSTQKSKESKVKETPNEIKPEENTINLQEVEHFTLPEEFNIQMEGDDHLKKVKIFPDGISEEPTTPPVVAN